MLLPRILLFSLLSIHVDNYKQSQTPKVWIPTITSPVSRNFKSKNSNPQFTLENKNPRDLAPPSSIGKKQISGSIHGDTQLDTSDNDIHPPSFDSDRHHPDNIFGKRHQTSTRKVRSPGQTSVITKNWKPVSSEELDSWIQGNQY